MPRTRSSTSSSAPKASPRETLWTAAPGPDPGHGLLGRADVAGAPRGDPGPALDLEPVQRPMGPPLPRDRRVAPRPVRHAHGRPGAGRGPDRLRPAGGLAAAPPRRPGLAGRWPGSPRPRIGGVGLRDVTRRMDPSPRRSTARRPRRSGPGSARSPPTTPSSPITRSPPPSRRGARSTAISSTPTCRTGFPTSAPNSAGSSSATTSRWLKPLLDQGFDVVHRGPIPDDRPPRDDQLGRKFRNFSDFARTKTRDKMSMSAYHCESRVSIPRGSAVARVSIAVARRGSESRSDRPGVWPGRIEVSGA